MLGRLPWHRAVRVGRNPVTRFITGMEDTPQRLDWIWVPATALGQGIAVKPQLFRTAADAELREREIDSRAPHLRASLRPKNGKGVNLRSCIG